MKHIDVYFLLTLGTEKQHHDLTTITHIMNTKFNIPWSPEMGELFMASKKPKTYHKVKWLDDAGYTRIFIAQYLGITRQSVANALAKPDAEYVNPWLHTLIRGVQIGSKM